MIESYENNNNVIERDSNFMVWKGTTIFNFS